MSHATRRELNAVLRHDLNAFAHYVFLTTSPRRTFVPNWHLEAINYRLDQCRRGEIRRLLITVPPRSLKSTCASVAFPGFVLGHDPSARIVCVSYSRELAGKLARDSRAVLESPWYRRAFPRTRIDPRKNTELEFDTTQRGYRLATSVGGTLTGRGGSYIILDDPMKPDEAMSETRRAAVIEWYESTLSSRLDDKTSDVIIVIMQRLHLDDLVGHLLSKDEPWVHLNLPAIAEAPQSIPIGPTRVYERAEGEVLHPVREPLAALEAQRAAMGSLAFSAQYQQAPVPPGGALVKDPWFRRYARVPDPRPGDRIIQSWDTASKASPRNDYSACTTWLIRGRDYYLIDVQRRRLEFPDLRRMIVGHAEAFDAKGILIEDAGSGTALIQDLKREGRVRPIGVRPKGEKIERLEGQSPVIEAGRVVIPDEAPWLGDFLVEVLSFPSARYDDQVDSMTQFLIWAAGKGNRPRTKPVPPILFTGDGSSSGPIFGSD